MTAHEIALTLMAERRKRHFCLPHYTPHGWFECDVYERTEAGFFYEYEIKVSRADFFADTKKERPRRPHPYGTPEVMEVKHEMLAAGHTAGPNYFTFIVPKGLIQINEVPEWAGLIEVEERPRGHAIPYRMSMRRVKDGPRLHTVRVAEKVITHSRGVCYYRLHDTLLELARVTAKRDPDKQPADHPPIDMGRPPVHVPGLEDHDFTAPSGINNNHDEIEH